MQMRSTVIDKYMVTIEVNYELNWIFSTNFFPRTFLGKFIEQVCKKYDAEVCLALSQDRARRGGAQSHWSGSR